MEEKKSKVWKLYYGMLGMVLSFLMLVLGYQTAGIGVAEAVEIKVGTEFRIENMEFKVISNEEVAVIDYLGEEKNVVIPAMVSYGEQNFTVRKIWKEAFSSCSFMENIEIPDSVTDIRPYAFKNCSGLKSIVIPDSVIKIGLCAFYKCSGLHEVKLPSKISSISVGLFLECSSLESVTIPNNVQNIDNSAFRACLSLKEIQIPDSVRELGNGVFAECISLKTIEIPDSVKSIGYAPFDGCSSLSDIIIPDELFGSKGIFLGCTGLTTLTIPENVSVIGERAFVNCKNLRSVNISDGVTKISTYAFTGCSNLESVTIPNSVTRICGYAFSACTSLKQIALPDSAWDIGNNIFAGCINLSDIQVSDYLIAKTRCKIYMGCPGVTHVTIPDTVTEICYYAFRNCSRLESVIIPDSVSKISVSAFDRKTTIQSSEEAYAHEYAINTNHNWSSLQAQNISKTPMFINKAKYKFCGDIITPEVTVMYGYEILEEDKDYKVIYENNYAPGIASIFVLGMNDYVGIQKITFTILADKVESLKQSRTQYSTSRIGMSWSEISGVNGYEVYRANTKNGSYKLLKSSDKNRFTDKELKPGSKFYYKVRAYSYRYDGTVYSEFSEPKCMVTKPAATSVAVSPQKGSAKITWTKSTGANGYEIYMATSRNGSYRVIKSANSLAKSYTKYGLKKGQRYYFKVRAYKLNGSGAKVYSGYSTIKAVTVK